MLLIVLGGAVVFYFIFRDRENSDNVAPVNPPTKHQINAIAGLLKERDAADLYLVIPKTQSEASALITELKERPYREDRDPYA